MTPLVCSNTPCTPQKQPPARTTVSNWPLADAVTHQGDGQGIAYVNEEPRLFHLVIDSTGLDWTVAVQEAVVGTPQ